MIPGAAPAETCASRHVHPAAHESVPAIARPTSRHVPALEKASLLGSARALGAFTELTLALIISAAG